MYYKAIVINTGSYWHKDRHIDQWSGVQSPEVNPCMSDQLIFNTSVKEERMIPAVFLGLQDAEE